jgi:hypothetical protein
MTRVAARRDHIRRMRMYRVMLGISRINTIAAVATAAVMANAVA